MTTVNIVRIERAYCLYPNCVLRPQYEVFSNGVSEGEFCKRHAQTMKRRIERDGEVDLYPTSARNTGAMSGE